MYLMTETTTFSNEYFHINLLMTPRCKAVIDNARENTCRCLKNFLTLIENRDEGQGHLKQQHVIDEKGKLFFKKCGSGDMQLQIMRTDNLPITLEYLQQYTAHLNHLVEEIFQATDALHVKEGTWQEALEYDEATNSFLLYLHRGLPRKLAQNYHQVRKVKKTPTHRRG